MIRLKIEEKPSKIKGKSPGAAARRGSVGVGTDRQESGSFSATRASQSFIRGSIESQKQDKGLGRPGHVPESTWRPHKVSVGYAPGVMVVNPRARHEHHHYKGGEERRRSGRSRARVIARARAGAAPPPDWARVALVPPLPLIRGSGALRRLTLSLQSHR